jgi:MFS family permease
MVETPVRWRDLFQGDRGKLTGGVLLVEFLVAVEALVIVAIMPAVRRDLGGLQYYGLVFTGFSLAALVATPLGGRAADRRGPAAPFLLFISIFLIGTVLCGLAPTMLALVLTRIIQGVGAGGAYTVALAAVTRSYSDAGRARVLALLAGAWIVPALLGPSFGALLASTVGWRWAFFSLVPLIVFATALAVPRLRNMPAVHDPNAGLSLRWPLQLGLGLTLIAVGATFPNPITLLLLLPGGVLSISALLAILPPGSSRARAGMPAGILIVFLLIFAFIGTEYFIPLMLTAIRGRSLAEGGIIVTLGALSWSIGNYWQSRVVQRVSAIALARLGVLILMLAIVGVMLMLTGAPLLISYVAWFLSGIGMGLAYPTAYLIIVREAPEGGEGNAVGAQQVAERLGLALGGAVGGACIALVLALRAPLIVGLTATFALALLAALGALLLAPRLQVAPS